MEVLGLISPIIGLITALINRGIIINQRYPSPARSYREPITLGKRFKRCLLAIALAMVFLCLVGAAAGGSDIEEYLIWPFAICLLVAAHQFLAMFILIFVKLWR